MLILACRGSALEEQLTTQDKKTKEIQEEDSLKYGKYKINFKFQKSFGAFI